ncbi:peptidoglycan recognition protein S3 [Nomia melanderi]|uniref:peptidoglycan recognition protein S3 n=1 Tax=Nomia melanderi TaxID=2448451 RepID=UPI00130478FF|nr:peptidoglycan-recognition protein 2-like [Nomia melanderi]
MLDTRWAIIFLFSYVCIAQGDEECPTIIKRNQWSTKEAKSVNYLILPIPYVIIHHTVTPECSSKMQCNTRVENIRYHHMDTLGWHDIGFSFLIGGDGNIYEGCGWNREGAHAIGYNKKSVGIAFIGNFQEKLASDNMINAAHKLIVCGKSQGILRDDVRVVGARQVTNTASPGIELYGQIQNWPEWVSKP